jgi:hypothetical protein
MSLSAAHEALPAWIAVGNLFMLDEVGPTDVGIA